MEASLTCFAIDRCDAHGDVISAWSFFAHIAGQPHQTHHTTTTAPTKAPLTSTAPRVWHLSIAPPLHHGLTTLITRHAPPNHPQNHHPKQSSRTHRIDAPTTRRDGNPHPPKGGGGAFLWHIVPHDVVHLPLATHTDPRVPTYTYNHAHRLWYSTFPKPIPLPPPCTMPRRAHNNTQLHLYIAATATTLPPI